MTPLEKINGELSEIHLALSLYNPQGGNPEWGWWRRLKWPCQPLGIKFFFDFN